MGRLLAPTHSWYWYWYQRRLATFIAICPKKALFVAKDLGKAFRRPKENFSKLGLFKIICPTI
jgi:hypothetical protein